jgi:hypothetical protein
MTACVDCGHTLKAHNLCVCGCRKDWAVTEAEILLRTPPDYESCGREECVQHREEWYARRNMWLSKYGSRAT